MNTHANVSIKRALLGASIVASLVVADLAAADNYWRGHHHSQRESVEISEHRVFSSHEAVDGATVLVRDGRGREITANISTRALEPDTAYSIWWAVFNHPRYCIDRYRCALADLGSEGDRRVRPSVFWAGGFISDASGIANTTVKLTPGRTSREIFAGTRAGLRNFWGAEIHAVLRSHGPSGLAGPVAVQIGTASEACPAEGCSNDFVSIHIPQH